MKTPWLEALRGAYPRHMESLLPYLLDFEKEVIGKKDADRVKAFWLKVAWELQSCAEAQELFPDMRICPVCLERESEGIVLHKLRGELFN
jgi:hypothetical protein